MSCLWKRYVYLHHKYKYHISFKCNDKKYNHTIKQLRPGAIADSLSENLFGKNTFSDHRFSINTIITVISLYYALNYTPRSSSTCLSGYMNIKVSHVTISKWIKKFDKYFNFIKSHSSLSNLTPVEVCGINYSHRDKIN